MRDLRFALVHTGVDDALDSFAALDVDRRGDLSEDDFFRALRHLGAEVSRSSVFKALDKFPGRKRGDVAYAELVRALKLPVPKRSGRPKRLEEGARVEARFRGRDRYFPGKIRRENRDGTFDVDYDDGERETGVREDLIRALDDAPSLREVDGVTLIASAVREQLWEWAKSFSGKGGHAREALRLVFQHLDKDKSGSIPRADMASLLQKKMKLKLAARDLEILLDCIDVEGDGRISYEDFVDFAIYEPEGEEVGVLHDRIARAVKASGEDLVRLLERHDDRRRGVVKADDLAKVLRRVGANLKPEDMDELLKRFAFKGSEVDYDVFASWVFSGSNLRKCEQRVRTSLQRCVSDGLDYRRIFTLLDRDGSGYLDGREFASALKRLGLMLTEGEARALFHKYDVGQRGQLRWADFLEVTSRVG